MRRSQSERGFVLVATLWVLAAMAVAAAYFSDRVSRARDLARQAQDASASMRDFESTRGEILFRFATEGLSAYGLGSNPAQAIKLDNRPYRGVGTDVVRLQDLRGLLNVNFPDTEMLFRLVGQFDVQAGEWSRMLDCLRDYTDEDDFRRLSGAESREYTALGLPPPPNEPLASPIQLKGALGWREKAALWRDGRFLQLVSAGRVPVFNPNTAPFEVLASLPGSSREIARAIIEMRRDAPIVSAQVLMQLTGVPPRDIEALAFAPGDSFRIVHETPGLPWTVQLGITMTPTSALGPWRVDYYSRSARAPMPAEESDIAQFPQRSARPAATAPAI